MKPEPTAREQRSMAKDKQDMIVDILYTDAEETNSPAELTEQVVVVDGFIPYSTVLAEMLHTQRNNRTRTVKLQAGPVLKTIGLQTDLRTREISTQTDPVQISPLSGPVNMSSEVCRCPEVFSETESRVYSALCTSPCKRPRLSHIGEPVKKSTPSNSDDELEDSFVDAARMDTSDLSYHPEASSRQDSSDSLHDIEIDAALGPVDEPKFIVFESKLMLLISTCPICTRQLKLTKTMTGSCLSVKRKCKHCKFLENWDSQPFAGRYPAGNILLSSSILFSGATPSKVLRLLNFINVACISSKTYFKHQQNVLLPAVHHKWEATQQAVAAVIGDEEIAVSGDGRCDSMGYSAKFGTYTTMDANTGLIIDIQLVQSSEVGSSYNMEVVGFKQSLAALEDLGLRVAEVITDRHVSIRKIMKEDHPDREHGFDAWHIGKSVKRKVKQAGKKKDMGLLQRWSASIVNHVYWSASSTPDGDKDVIEAKWTSLTNHVMNVHDHDNQHFSRCLHGELEGNEGRKAWIMPGTKAAIFLEKLVADKRLIKDITQISPKYQTSNLEAFHSVINHFAPKMIGFGYRGLYGRVLIAALHFNENVGRDQAVDENGELKYSITFPKFKQGGYSLRKVKTAPTYDYVHELMMLSVDMF